MTNPIIAFKGASKTYPAASGPFTALHDISLTIDKGEFVVVVGQSGSGKSTLLSLLSGIEKVSAGEVHVDGMPVHDLSERKMSPWRGRTVGIVFQFFQLLPTLTAVENVMLPMDFCGKWRADERRDRATGLLERLGVADQANKIPSTLSGGQQQRVAVARALANAPAVLLADEPTGNLDSRTARAMLDLIAALSAEGQTVVMATHERGVREYASRTITLADGKVVSDERLSA